MLSAIRLKLNICPGRAFSKEEPEESAMREQRGFTLIEDPFCIDRHDGYGNCLFMDWSVRRIGLKELWTLKWHRRFNTANSWTRAGGVQPGDWPQWIAGYRDY